MIESGMTRDQIIIALVTTYAVSVNKATTAYAAYAKANGLTTALVSYKTEALAYLDNLGGAWDADTVADAVIDLQDKFGVAESTARDYTKAYSDLLGVPHPIRDARELMFSWLIAHAGHDPVDMKAKFKEYATDLGRSPSNINEYWKGYELHLAIVAATK
jgi:hypothetical protein